ncbi:CRISPR system precrRNA processing endoribonuclease RAMP protein Cas6 [Geomesophilobacter sediminis]|uniref:CRISPR system precrRNA processing endoribonuclease RAMP protein Cas6 n=1 Tax=Geomesophilobacter sediminis TaxID=2798584 RepID=A0A8J7M3X2_9BACT|nr:CRISPR system precrRNA processing endoribonuclease RAMP protein Cas6 [Geomesophilobacter sediminis]MBJ6727653.1 CRISPR system precrRNA processing endoribonuclease RAMP protein Cas6 [Geomesophilobacter sediminis]
MEFDYLTIRVTLRSAAPIPDPYALFAGRARFDAAFRTACGCSSGDCRGCRKTGTCPYPANFAQSISCDPDAVRRHQKPPLPFVFSFPVLDNRRDPESTCSLTLFGSATQSVGPFCAALALFLDEHGLTVLHSEALAQGGEAVPLRLEGADAAALPILSSGDLALPLAADRVTVRFLTPVKVLQEGRPLRQLDFSHLVRPLLRRASAVASYYGGCELPFDYPWLSGQSLQVRTDAADWRFAEWGKRVSGMVGSATFRGELEPFHLLLRLGEVLHLGKNAPYGQGQFRLEP